MLNKWLCAPNFNTKFIPNCEFEFRTPKKYENRTKNYAQIFTLREIPSPLGGIKNLFHSDLPIDAFYPLRLEFWEILRNGLLKRFDVNNFDLYCNSQ